MQSTLSARQFWELHPKLFERWVTTAAALIGGAYLLVWATDFVGEPSLWDVNSQKIPVFAAAVLAAVLARHGRALWGGYLLVAALWFQFHASYLFLPSGIHASTTGAVAVVVLAAGLLAGGRVGLAVAGTSSVTIPVCLIVGPGPPLAEHPISLAVLIMALWGTAYMVDVFLRSFSEVLDHSRATAGRMADLVRELPDGVLRLDDAWHVIAANPAAVGFLGMEAGDLIGLKLGEVLLEDESTPLGTGRAATTIRAPLTGQILEVRVRRAEIGHDNRRLVILRNITERMEAEQRSEDLQKQLLHAQKLEAVGQLAGGVAHDFNNLLTAVGTCGDLLAEEPSEFVQELAEDLKEAQVRGTALTRQLLAFARKEEVQPRLVDVTEVVRGVDKLMRHMLDEHYELCLELDDHCHAVVDPGHLEQVVLNLVANGRDAMRGGGTLRVSTRSTDGRVLLEVSDQGTGIDAATLERIFEPFYTTKPRGKGTGLGLSTVHGIVTQAGGLVEVDTSLGRGTTFRVVLPQAEASTSTTGEFPAPASEQAPNHARVLLVEDEPLTMRFTSKFLRKRGFEVDEAGDAPEALRHFGAHPPDLLLTDVGLPGMDGVELAKRLRQLDPELPVLFLTGYQDKSLEGAPFDALHDLVIKPFGSDDLVRRLRKKLEQRDA